MTSSTKINNAFLLGIVLGIVLGINGTVVLALQFYDSLNWRFGCSSLPALQALITSVSSPRSPGQDSASRLLYL